jgi:hypothetical protein
MARNPTQPHDPPPFGQAVRLAHGADALVTIEDLLAHIAGIGPEPPLHNAVIRAEREPAFGDLQAAPTAKVAAMGSFGKCVAVGAAAGHDARGTHVETFYQGCVGIGLVRELYLLAWPG